MKNNVKEKVEKGWIHSIIIIEILGRPADHVKKSMEALVDELGKVKGVEIAKKEIHEPKEIEKHNLFTTFAEVEILTENFKKLTDLIFEYMPSSIEIMEPQEAVMNINEANNLVNDLTARLHRYDAVAKTLMMQNKILQTKIEGLEGKKKAEDKKE
jgi:hypothetical protein